MYFYAHSAENTPGVYIYIPTYWGLRFGGTPSTRLDLRLFNSSACQKHQCTLCSLIVLFLCLSPAPFRSFPSRSFSCRAYALSLFFSLSREYTTPFCPTPPSPCPSSLVLSNRPDFPSPFGTLPFARGRRFPSGWRTIRSNTLR